ncbi:MAG: Holliday junction resolvase RuvX [Deltaproteobacteria bacterium]|nr:Holliday junction resolvase RuvX [Deltaproteobacteria bacterium]
MHLKRVMGLDVGDARVGVALSDPLCISAQPHSCIKCKRNEHFKEIVNLAQKMDVSVIVVGLPKKLDGSIDIQAKKVLDFVKKLKTYLERETGACSTKEFHPIHIKLWDERFSTVEAERILAGNKVKKKAIKEHTDKISASLIVESYLMATNKDLYTPCSEEVDN